MSEFSFTDETPNNDGGDAEGFSFGDSPENGGASEFSFGAEEQEEVKAPAPKPAAKPKTVQRKGPRVIGQGKKPGKDKKVSKFAKKGTETEKPKHTAKLTPGVIPPIQKVEPPKPVEEESAFDFGAADDTPATNNDETSAFDFGAADDTPADDETSAFDFGAAEETPAAEENEASAFDFGAAEEEPAAPQVAPAPVQPQVQTPPAPVKVQVQAPVQTPVPAAADEVPEVHELGEDYGNFAHSINSIATAVKDMYAESESWKLEIESSEKQQQEALENEEFDKAEQLDQRITELKEKIIENETNFSYALQEVFENANQTPDHLESHADKAKTQLPDLQKTQETLEKRLAEEEEKQTADKTTIEIERRKNAQTIDDLQAPINQHTSAIEELQKQYDENVAKASEPFDEKITSLETEKKEVNNKIADLLKQVEVLRSQDKKLQLDITKEQKGKKAAIDAFQADSKKIAAEKRTLESEKRKVALEIKKIEAPFQSLLDDVEKREKQINTLTEQLATTRRLVTEAQSDIEQSDKAVELIKSLCETQEKYSQERAALAESLEANRKLVTESTARVERLGEELIVLNTHLASAKEILSSSEAKEEQLQAQKVAAVSSKNFKAAKVCADQIKELKEATEKAQKTVENSNTGIKNNEAESEDLKSKITTATAAIEEESGNLNKMDYDFFEQAIESLDNLFKTSPFGEKLLHGLKEMLATMLEHTEQPKQLTKEEIQAQIDEYNTKLEAAVAADDFDTAEQLQNKIDSLTEKLKKFE